MDSGGDPERQPGRHRRGREQVRHHSLLADGVVVLPRLPAAGRAGEEVEQTWLVDRAQHPVEGGGFGDLTQVVPRGTQCIGNDVDPGGHLDGGRLLAHPDLVHRVVGAGLGRPQDRDGGDVGTGTCRSHHTVTVLRQDCAMPRARDLGIRIGTLPTGPTDSVLDVAGVGLGHATVRRDEAAPPEGRGSARTGVTTLVVAEDAYLRPVPAGGAVLNGAGECTGFLAAAEWGALESPVFLTSTMQLGRVYDAACEIALEQHPEVAGDVVIPVVAECDDSFLNDCRRMQVTHDDVRTAYAAALASRGGDAAPALGAVGAGAGMTCLGFKGGIGSSSRVTPEGHTVAVLLLTNFGERAQLTVSGVRMGDLLPPSAPAPSVPRAPASASSSPTRRSTAPGAPGWHVGSAWGWPAPARSRATAAARSSWLPPPAAGSTGTAPRTVHPCSQAGGSTRCSSPWSTPPRRPCSTPCSAPRPSSAMTATPARPCRRRRWSRSCASAGSSTVAEPTTGSEREVRIRVRDGVELAATLFLPDPAYGPQPCLLEALPYRKDDLTASYADSYRRLRDEHLYAVCRLDLRGTGSSSGDATDEYPAAEQARPRRGDRLARRPDLVHR